MTKEAFEHFKTAFREGCQLRGCLMNWSAALTKKITLPSRQPRIGEGFLDLRTCNLNDDHAAALAQALRAVPIITEVDLHDNCISDEGAEHILHAMRWQHRVALGTPYCTLCVECEEDVPFDWDTDTASCPWSPPRAR